MIILYILIGIAITGVVYLAFPLFYVKKYGKVGREKAWVIALINFFTLHIVFTIIAIAVFDAAETTAGPILWLFISKSILTVGAPKEEQIRLCSECGYQIFPEEQKCGNCGKKRIMNCEQKYKEDKETKSSIGDDNVDNLKIFRHAFFELLKNQIKIEIFFDSEYFTIHNNEKMLLAVQFYNTCFEDDSLVAAEYKSFDNIKTVIMHLDCPEKRVGVGSRRIETAASRARRAERTPEASGHRTDPGLVWETGANA